jgi:hypothetical protein
MDITPYLGPIVTALIAFGATYAAFSARLTKLETMIEDLRRDVEKHNQVVERTYKLETEVDNLYHRYDELRLDVKDAKIGGTE